MNEENKLITMQEDDLTIIELDSRFDMSIIDPLSLVSGAVPIVIQEVGCTQAGCVNNCVAGC
jgi:hypothetical protein